MTGDNSTTREKLGSVFFALVMVTSMMAVGGAAFAGSAAAADVTPSTDVSVNDDGTGNTATYTASADASADTGGGSLNSISLGSVGSGVDFSGVDTSTTASGGTNSDITVDVGADPASSDISGVSTSNNDETLDITFSGNVDIAEGDTITVEVSGVTNPDTTGPHTFTLNINDNDDGTSDVSYTDSSSFPVVNTDTGDTFDTIQAAIDDPDTDSGDTIEVDAEGQPYNEQVTVDKGVTLTSINGQATISDATANNAPAVKVIADGATVSGFEIERDVASASEFAQSVQVENADNVEISDNLLTTANLGDTANSGGLLIQASEAGDATNPGSDSSGVTIDNNVIDGADFGIYTNADGQEITELTITGNDVTNVESNQEFVLGAEPDGTIGTVNGESETNAQIQAVVTDNDGIDTTAPFGVELSTTEITVGNSDQLDVELFGIGSESVDYAILDTDEDSFPGRDAESNDLPAGSDTIAADDVLTSGSSSDNTFSALLEASSVGDYTIVAEGSTTNVDGVEAVTSTYTVDNRTLDPAEPVYNDDLTVSGSLADGSGNAPDGSQTVALVDPAGSSISSTSATSSGEFLLSGTLNDAGAYELTDGSGTAYDSFTVGPQQANVTLNAAGNNTAGFEESYTLSLQDGDGNQIDFDSVDGYVNVTGPFQDGTIDVTDNNDAVSTSEVIDGDTNDDVDEGVRIQPDGDAQDETITFTANPATDAGSVTATLENNGGNGVADLTASVNGGAEDTTPATYESPDYVGSDDLSVSASEGLNVAVLQPDDGDNNNIEATDDDANNDIEVEVLGSDGSAADGTEENPANDGASDGSNVLSNATVTLSGPGVDEEVVLGDDEVTTSTTFDAVSPDEAGVITVNVSAVDDDGNEFTATEEVDVTGDKIASVSPQTATIEDSSTVAVQVTNADDTPVNNRQVVITQNNTAELTVYDQVGPDSGTTETGVTTLTINGNAGTVSADGDTIADDFVANNGEYVAENVTFATQGTLDVYVGNDAADPATGGDTRSAQSLEAIEVQGIDAYDIESGTTPLVAGIQDTANFTVTEDGTVVNGTDLSDLSSNFDVTQGTDNDNSIIQGSASLVDTNDDNTDDAIQADVLPTTTDQEVNVTISDGAGRTGESNISVLAPEVATNVTDNTLTERLTTTAELTVQDPRTGDQIDNANIRYTVYNGTAEVAQVDDDYSGEARSTDGSGAEAVTTGDLADGNTTVDLQAYDPADEGDFVVSLSAQVDDSFVTATNLSVEPMQVTASPESITLGETATVTVNAQDANGDAIASQRVDLAGAGVNIEGAGTDNGGVVNVVTNPQATGAIGIYVDSDDDLVTDANSPPVVDNNNNPENALEAEIPVQTQQQATFGINEGTLDPDTVTGNQTVTHTLTFSANSMSNDGNSDTFTVTLPDSVEITNANSVTVTDAEGNEIDVSSSPSLSDANGGTNNQVQFGIQPGDSSFNTSTVTVETSIDVAFPSVNESLTAPVNASVADSTAGSAGPTTVADVTIQPEGELADPPADWEGNTEQYNAIYEGGERPNTQEISNDLNEWFNSDDGTVNGVAFNTQEISNALNYWFNDQ